MAFTVVPLTLPGVLLITPTCHEDSRGYFIETYKRSAYERAGIPGTFVQENQSRSARNTLRGLHFQRAPKAQAKLVRVLAGEIFDVAVDIRPGSATFGRWVGATLSGSNRQTMYIPEWCAHGFCVVSADAEVLYKTTAEYAPELEGGIAWNDPAIGITWPVSDPVLSERDRRWPSLNETLSRSGHGST